MTSKDEIRELIERINNLGHNNEKANEESEEFWRDSGARLLIFIDQLVVKTESTFAWVPKDISNHKNCILTAIFNILANMSDVNRSFNNSAWNDDDNPKENLISFYELALSRCCSLICQQLSDRFQYIQKLLIKNLFNSSDVCSFFASDIYMFIFRLISPAQRMAMCQLVMNLCRIAPPDKLVNGAALINRFKHPVVNFENPKYQYLMDFSR